MSRPPTASATSPPATWPRRGSASATRSRAQWFQPATGDWRTQPATKAYGGSLLLAKGATESLATSFRGKAVALAGAVGPGRGSFRVRVDEGAWTTVSLKTKKAGQRRVVWSRVLQGGPHSVEVQGLSGQSALDAILIVR